MTTTSPVERQGAEEEAAALAVLERFQPGIRERYARRAALDPAFAYTWLRYGASLLGRDVLDARTRLLVMTGQFTMSRRHDRLRETVVAAIREDLDLLEVKEVILQCAIYGGESIVDPALEIFADEVERVGRLDEVAERGLRVDQMSDRRDLTAERSQWHPEDAADPRADELAAKYGLPGISMALVLRPRHTLDTCEFLSSLDEDFTRAFYNFSYANMYGRLVLDHRTRLLCMVGNTLAIGELVQTQHHIRTALRQGAKPREVLEVLLQSVFVVGHPNIVPLRFRDLTRILAEEGLEL
jgi:alkylhydroperoxidase/carboxymuconolactone decarboxylase family protein YurZ